ncbi:MAG: flagellar assembly protein FliH [Bacteroides sp.]|nr:flagellar assembly protein FliH [Prevotella sp.]MCM1407422.1 flagellar assembly protein FliH [Treponema brennaborense]MCM1469912.1 flagellar assembly protein FliH [Bacteroides sp.]
MAKAIFKPTEITKTNDKVMLQLSHSFAPPEEENPEVAEPEYTGPTAEDLRREAEEFKKQWEIDKQRILDEAKAEAEKIVQDAKKSAFDEIRQKSDQIQVMQTEASEKAEQFKKDAEAHAEDILKKADEQAKQISDDAYRAGYDKGVEDGFAAGKTESDRLIGRLHTVIEKTMERRTEILDETEQQIVELVLLMARKVVKVMSESQRNVVMTNIVHALRKVKGRGEVTLRVNFADVKLTSEHIQDFIKAVESVKDITVVEDTTVGKGGCIVETDFGAIDARISSQLNELEQKILEIAPIKNVTKLSDAVSDI